MRCDRSAAAAALRLRLRSAWVLFAFPIGTAAEALARGGASERAAGAAVLRRDSDAMSAPRRERGKGDLVGADMRSGLYSTQRRCKAFPGRLSVTGFPRCGAGCSQGVGTQVSTPFFSRRVHGSN
jgi:hypothetical protein